MSDRLSFQRATASDEDDIRRLFSENPMGGRYSISIERALHALKELPELTKRHTFIIAREASGAAAGICERVVRRAFVNGVEQRLPYLAALRIAKSHRHHIQIMKDGFEMVRRQGHASDELPFALTSIAADNGAARRLLTAGLEGLPTYRLVGGYSTLVLRPRRYRTHHAITVSQSAEQPEVSGFLRRELSRYQFAPAWSEQALQRLPAEQFLLHRTKGAITGCLSVWNQCADRQFVIRAYPPAIGALRTAINLVAPFFRIPHLPAVGTSLPQIFFSHIAIHEDDPDILRALIEAGLSVAATQGHGAATIGIATDHGAKSLLKRRFGGIEYKTLLYLVHWKEGAAAAAACDERLPWPDVGLL